MDYTPFIKQQKIVADNAIHLKQPIALHVINWSDTPNQFFKFTLDSFRWSQNHFKFEGDEWDSSFISTSKVAKWR